MDFTKNLLAAVGAVSIGYIVSKSISGTVKIVDMESASTECLKKISHQAHKVAKNADMIIEQRESEETAPDEVDTPAQ